MKSVRALVITAAFIAAAVSSALATEPRPWLCRDKPVFTSSTPVTYDVATNDSRRWLLTIMRFELGSGHDGFTVISSQTLGGRVGGALGPGSYYAVALYRQGDHWICPGYAREADEPKPGVVADLCYGENRDDCRVRLTVLPRGTSSTSAASPDAQGAP
ncbi:MAG: hypothetical protein ACREQN_13960 [Candidatus Binataceae bacterium]